MIDSWCPDPTSQFYTKQPMKVDDVNLMHYYRMMTEQKDKGPAEGGFVDCLLEIMWLQDRMLAAINMNANTKTIFWEKVHLKYKYLKW